MADYRYTPLARRRMAAPAYYRRRDPLTSMFDEVDRLMGRFIRNYDEEEGEDHGLAQWRFSPQIDFDENDDKYEISVELPGTKKEDVDLKIENGVLVISGEKKQARERDDDQGRGFVRERAYGHFQRRIQLPETIDEEGIEARYEDGVLTIDLPKIEPQEAQARKIDIS